MVGDPVSGLAVGDSVAASATVVDLSREVAVGLMIAVEEAGLSAVATIAVAAFALKSSMIACSEALNVRGWSQAS